jgi:hypothetical protein
MINAMHHKFLLIAMFSLAIFTPEAVFAAEEDRCVVDYELIFNLKSSAQGSYSIWDSTHGQQEKQEKYTAAVLAGTHGVVTAGMRFTHEGGEKDLILTEFDRRGRVAWEKEHKIAGLLDVVKMLPREKGYMVLANRKTSKNKADIWIGFFDEKGEKTSEQSIRESAGNLSAQDIIPLRGDQKGYFLAAAFEGTGTDKRKFARLYHLNTKAAAVKKYSYITGLENRILGLAAPGGADYIAAGYSLGEDGRKNGWVLKFDDEGNIIWQRQYPRGRSAQLSQVADLMGRFVVVAGDTEPASGARQYKDAGWLMVLDGSNGNIGWQRYYTGDTVYHARDLMTTKDGLISLLLATGPSVHEDPAGDTETEGYARLLTINPRGGLFISDEYFNGTGAYPERMIEGSVGERIIIGSTDMIYEIEGIKTAQETIEPKTVHTREGWIAAAVAAEPYEDPCLEPYNFLP